MSIDTESILAGVSNDTALLNAHPGAPGSFDGELRLMHPRGRIPASETKRAEE
ncbi:MAG: hypothetical protein H0T47_20065 [Planctomycetaceae bacterium]|nr:hypothetical protein [Planctomycetaceae bacterium]